MLENQLPTFLLQVFQMCQVVYCLQIVFATGAHEIEKQLKDFLIAGNSYNKQNKASSYGKLKPLSGVCDP